MADLRFHLLGKFRAERGTLSLGLDASKERELISYLLIHRDRPHPREALATLLWGDTSTEKSRKYLRQTLWHLRGLLRSNWQQHEPVLVVEHDWVQLNLGSDLWLDVAALENAFTNAQGIPGRRLEPRCAQALKDAVKLYRGDLLDGWYHDWCLFERERVQNMYLSMLDKLMMYCEERREYDLGMSYGASILRYDRARERTHRQMMYLQYLSGDRTGALRQYERCAAALDQELGVKPEDRTVALYHRISTGKLDLPESSTDGTAPPEILGRLKRLQLMLTAMQKRVSREIKTIELGLRHRTTR